MKKEAVFEKIFVVVPAFNEEKVIVEVVKEIQAAGFPNIILIDDGSTDQTYLRAKDLEGVKALRHKLNRGKGAAVKTGIEAAKLLKARAVATVDGDGQHNPEDIKRMVKLLSKGYDVVLGSRMINCQGMPSHKILANKVANGVTWLVFGLWVTDSQSGLRVYSDKAIRLMNIRGDGYEYDSEAIREIRRNKLKYKEVPIEVRYTNYSTSKTEKQNLVNGFKTLARMIWGLIS